jgi:hypothetical protein
MSAKIEALMGEVATDPDGQERDVQLLLQSFLRALAEEQRLLKHLAPSFGDSNSSNNPEAP